MLLRDMLIYIGVGLGSFACVGYLWSVVFQTFRNRGERSLFWTSVAGVAIMGAGVYHLILGERDIADFFFVVGLLVALGAAVFGWGRFIFVVSKAQPYDPEKDPEFIAWREEQVRLRNLRLEAYRREALRGPTFPRVIDGTVTTITKGEQ